MYRTSFGLFRVLLPYVALAVIGEILLVAAEEKFPIGSGKTVGSALIWSYLAFNAHAEMLLPKSRDKNADSRRVLGFAVRTFGLGVLFVLPAIILIFPYIGQLFTATTWNEVLAAWGVIGLVLAFFFVIVFSLLGSLLPAFVADHARGFGPALARGRSQFFWTASRLVAGPIAAFALAQLVILSGNIYMDPHIDLLTANYIPNVPLFAVLILGYLIQALGTIMIAVVLSTAFLRAEESASLPS